MAPFKQTSAVWRTFWRKTMAKRKNRYKCSWDGDIFVKEYVDEQTQKFDCRALPDEVYVGCRASRHGIQQKINDSHSGEEDLDLIREASAQTFQALTEGNWIMRIPGSGLGLGINYDLLVRAVAAVKFGGEGEAEQAQARATLDRFLPTEDDDDDAVKEKKAHLRKIRNMGVIKVKIDELQGKTLESLLSDVA